jgi:hypothetical protein
MCKVKQLLDQRTGAPENLGSIDAGLPLCIHKAVCGEGLD